MEEIAVEHFPNSVDPGINEKKSEFHCNIGDDSDQDACDLHDHVFHIFKQIFEDGILVSGMSTVW